MGLQCKLILLVAVSLSFPCQAQEDTVTSFSSLFVSYRYDETGNRVSRMFVIPMSLDETQAVIDTNKNNGTENIPIIAANSPQVDEGRKRSSHNDEDSSISDSGADVASETRFEDQVGNIKVFLYPNPVKESFTVKIQQCTSELGDLHYNLYSLSGKLLQQGFISDSQPYMINLESYRSGTYLFEMMAGSYKQVWKVIKQ